MAGKLRIRRQRGSAIVETAISISLYFMLLFGIVGLAQAVWAYTFVAHAAREGTRYASVRGSQSGGNAIGPGSCSGTSGACGNITNFITGLTMMGLDSTKMTVAASWAPSNDPGNSVTVTVSYNTTWLAFLPSNLTVSSSSTMNIAQ